MKWTLTLSIIAVFTGTTAAQNPLADTLRKAVVEEESQHNLPAAEADYQRVVAQFDEERKTGATALFRLAECYRKVHKDAQAKAAYERVVREFADQEKLAQQSRAVLASEYKESKPDDPSPADRAQVSAMSAARQHYRDLLIAEIETIQIEEQRMNQQVQLGVVGPEAVTNVKLQKLRLQRDLAAFDMGVMPAEVK